ncbi:MAG: glycoside hydrolase family 97 protein [Bacteroidaceae bacterium]|nr:glycoside hydrolase family 97 protein [Bacteroidaceae bacterium]
MKRFLLLSLALLSLACGSFAADKMEALTSPSGNIRLEVTVGERLTYSAFRGSEQILKDCPLSLQVGKDAFGTNPKLSGTKRTKVDEVIRPVVPLKYAEVANRANQLTLSFRGGISVDFRAYDNGIAYRFAINRGKGQVDVVDEGLGLNLPESFMAHVSKTRSFNTSYENPYTHISTADYNAGDEMTYLPILLESPQGTKVLFSESDVRDYPHLFLMPTDGNGFTATFPRSPETWEPRGDRSWTITKERDCIARTDAQRTLPWRFAVIGTDKDIAENQMEVVLGGKCELDDTSWIKPGKVNWDWWNHWTVWDVDFETGINNDTYKYIIDCASKFGVEYILLDEGWNKRVQDPFTTRDEINVKELVEYGRQKNVGIVLWLSWLTVEQHMDLIPFYAKMGVKGLKIDFMDHSDQWMVNFYERVARECAKNKLLVDYHGSFKPSGMEQRLPNLISYEGVRGLEQGGGCKPENSIWLPFMRNAVGPMDFTPGAMHNAQPEDNRGSGSLPMGGGTRAYQMALYVCFESGLQMLADSPTRYLREAECTEFIASVPTTWDETRVLAARAGDYYVVAKRKGSRWFIGAMTGDKAQDIDISLDFLGKGGRLTYFRDGRNAHRIALDYRREQQDVTPQTKLRLHLVRNGGWAGVIE